MTSDQQSPGRPRVLFVGAFPPEGREVYGGNVTDCRILRESSLAEKMELILLDSTQVSNPPPGLLKRFFLAARRFGRFIHLFETNSPDALLIFSSGGASILEKGLMAWWGRLRGIPALIFPRGGVLIEKCGNSVIFRWLVRNLLRGTTKFLCQGETWQRFAVHDMGFESLDAPIIRNWTATDDLLEIGIARFSRPLDEKVTLLFVGWLEKEKGIEELLRACGNLAESRQFRLVLVGDGKALPFARKLVEDLNLQDHVEFKGWLKRDALKDAFREANVFVLPSWVEGLPNAMIEAMACGLAVVVSRVGNIPDLLSEDEAMLVEPRDVISLEHSLARVIDDPVIRRGLGEKAHVIARESCGVDQAVDSLVTAIDSVVE